MKRVIALGLLLLTCAIAAWAQDPGWPRELSNAGGTGLFYQPQVDDWKDFSELTWRMAFSLTPAGGRSVVGVIELQGHTDIDNDDKLVFIKDLRVIGTHFPSLDPSATAQMDQLVRTFVPPTVTISLHRLVAVVDKTKSGPNIPVKNDPPTIVVSYQPAILLALDGDPVYAEVPKTKLKFVVNTSWPLFFDQEKSTYYLLVDRQWITAGSLDGPWSPTNTLSKEMSKVPDDPQWATLRSVIPPTPLWRRHPDGVLQQSSG